MAAPENIGQAMARHGLRCAGVSPVEIRHRLWLCLAFEEKTRPLGDHPHLALIHTARDWLAADDLGTAVLCALSGRHEVLTRVHSECILGEAFGSSMCDCGEQIRLSMEEIEAQTEGLIVYLRQEGRGIGLRSKLDCLALQYGYRRGKKSGERYSPDEANLALGYPVDARNYAVAAALAASLSISSVRLITGNPEKIADLEQAGVEVESAIDLRPRALSARATAEIREKIARGYSYLR